MLKYQETPGLLQEVMPAACPHGHPYVPGNVSVGWCGAHRYYDCQRCRVEGRADPRVCYRTRD